MLSVTYCAQNYADISSWSLMASYVYYSYNYVAS